MIFRLTQKTKFKYLYIPLLKGFVINILTVLIMSFFYHVSDLTLFLKLFFGVFAFQMIFYNIPLLFFYYNYYKRDLKTLFYIDDKEYNFVYENAQSKILFTKDDIIKVVFHLPPALYDRRSTLLHWDEFFFSEIITKRNSFKISCLVINNLEEFISEEKIERFKVYFPLIKD